MNNQQPQLAPQPPQFHTTLPGSSPYRIEYITLQQHISHFQKALHDSLSMFTANTADAPVDLPQRLAQFEQGYTDLLVNAQHYINTLLCIEQQTLIEDAPINPHFPIPVAPNTLSALTPYANNYDIDYRAIVRDDIELSAVLDCIGGSTSVLPSDAINDTFSNLPTHSYTTPIDGVPADHQNKAIILAKVFSLQNANLSLPFVSSQQGMNVPLAFPQLSASQNALVHAHTMCERIRSMTRTCYDLDLFLQQFDAMNKTSK